jgi:hypothetical protein
MFCINTLIIYIYSRVYVKYKIEMKIDKYKIINNPNTNKFKFKIKIESINYNVLHHPHS